ncbi:MAG: DNA replication/repair protein RecF [Bacteroidales bacterium]|jgi:DNA replication and repair protein RecF|nr:DNA replication/repair protein RecF [Bacteroidales bacterium]
MYLKNLVLNNFKNYELVEIEFSPRINCLAGANGVGKTNILDAIHYLSLAKSFFNGIDSMNIRHGEECFSIQGEMLRGGDAERIYCSFHRQKQKALRRNGKEYRKLSEHVGRYPVVMISPADSLLITGGSEERRRFMNRIISQYDAVYLESVVQYNRAVMQRNRMLKDFKAAGRCDADLLAVWDAQLATHGSYIHSTRRKLVDDLKPVFQQYYSLISSSKETVRLDYVSHLDGGSFEQLLAESLKKDLYLEYTTAGVHKDNLSLEMDGFQVKATGSQGQQKTFLAALKLAKFDYIRRMAGHRPMLLLDDIFDKFDAGRVEQIMHIVSGDTFGQIFITDTHCSRLHSILPANGAGYRLFGISENTVSEINTVNNETK